MTPIFCIGENSRDENGLYLDEIRNQIKSAVDMLGKRALKKLVVAYEPVWSIGQQDAVSPDDVQTSMLFIKKVFAEIFGSEVGLKVSVLYGGSVNRINAPDLIRVGQVDGLLVGRESVNGAGFSELLKAVDRSRS
jgi:triosephosphate isomerase